MQAVHFFCSTGLGGVRTYTINLAAYLEANGYMPRITFYEEHNQLGDIIRHEELKKRTTYYYSRYAKPETVYRKLISQTVPEEVLICNDLFEIDAINSAKLTNKLIFILHGDLPHYESILQRYSGLIDKVLCVSTGLFNKYAVLYPELSFSVCHPLVVNTEIKGRSDKSVFTAAYIGRFEYMKGADDFIKIVSAAHELRLPIRWEVYVPDGGRESDMISQLPESVVIHSGIPNEEVLERLWDIDFFVFMSRSEGFGIVLLEAIKRGVVAIARHVPIGVPDILRNEQNGFLVADAGGAISVLSKLCSDGLLRERIRTAAFHFGNTRFDFDKCGATFVNEVLETIQKEKVFRKHPVSFLEKLLPEYMYRISKRIKQIVRNELHVSK